MASRPIREIAIVAIYVSPGVKVGASGFVIINGKIHVVPPRGPVTDVVQQLAAGLAVMSDAEQITDAAARRELVGAATKVVESAAAHLPEVVGHAFQQ
ncbi:MAG: hypothetical protein M3176_04160 [Chloroflexota bacterium]|nr:hypothetical protein [Chloroflexota bacterium]MDQ6906004.1 hypothetical protein [Chloroflexota bacterium]